MKNKPYSDVIAKLQRRKLNKIKLDLAYLEEIYEFLKASYGITAKHNLMIQTKARMKSLRRQKEHWLSVNGTPETRTKYDR